MIMIYFTHLKSGTRGKKQVHLTATYETKRQTSEEQNTVKK
jgi:hypothetical protein